MPCNNMKRRRFRSHEKGLLHYSLQMAPGANCPYGLPAKLHFYWPQLKRSTPSNTHPSGFQCYRATNPTSRIQTHQIPGNSTAVVGSTHKRQYLLSRLLSHSSEIFVMLSKLLSCRTYSAHSCGRGRVSGPWCFTQPSDTESERSA